MEKEDYNLNDIGLLIQSFIKLLLNKIIIFFLITVMGALIGFGCFFTQRANYNGVSSFVMQEKSGSVGSFAGLVSQLGADITGANSGSSLFAGENILDILKSKKIISEVLLTNITEEGVSKTLIHHYLDFSGLRNKWKNNEELQRISFPIGTNTLNPLQDSVIQIVYKRIIKSHLKVERTNKKSSVMEVAVSSKSRVFSKYMSERLINAATEFYVNNKTSLIRRNVRKLEYKSDSILRLLNYKTYSSEQKKIIDPNPAQNKTIMIPAELDTRDKNILLSLYGEIIKNLELARVTLMQETPLIQILDTPGISLEDNKMSKAICVLLGSLIFFCFTFVFYFLKHFFFNK